MDGNKGKKRLTVFVVPEGETNLRRLQVPAWLFSKRIWQIVAMVAIVLGIHYGISVHRSVQVSELLAENKALRDNVAQLSGRVESIKSDLERVDTLDYRVRAIFGLEYPSEVQNPGLGGPLVPNMSAYEGLDPKDANRLRRLDHDIFDAKHRVSVQEQSLEDLLNHFSEQRSQLASTPSIWPTRGWLTSTFGARRDPFTNSRTMHHGLDVAASIGTPVVAPADGVVVFVGARSGYGKVLTIDHGYGVSTVYGHLSEANVAVGDEVRRGDEVAAVGNTGRSTGPHLHYEVRVNDVPVDPMKYILN